MIRSFSVLVLVALLQACATYPVDKSPNNASSATQSLNHQHLEHIAQIKGFALKGRIGVQTENEGFSGTLDWSHDLNTDDIAIYSPLGGQVASIKKTPDMVTLEDAKGHRVSAQDAETLTENTLGWRLPLTGLADWSLGRPTHSPVQASSWDDKGHLITLKQDGWDINYSNYLAFDGYQLPGKVVLRSTKVNIKLIIENRSSIKY